MSHIKTDTRLQDAQKTDLHRNDRVISIIVSDGAGSAEFGGQGASIVCRTLSVCIRKHYEDFKVLPTPGDIEQWIKMARHHIENASKNRRAVPRDFASTLVMAVSDGEESVFAQIGDGAAVFRPTDESKWIVAIWPNQGEYASTTFFVTDEGQPQLRVCHVESPLRAIAVFTDGIERIALDFSNHKPHEPFFDAMLRPLESVEIQGRDVGLCKKLGGFLASDRVNARTDDDKTLVVSLFR